jgi:hypothetical protein
MMLGEIPSPEFTPGKAGAGSVEHQRDSDSTTRGGKSARDYPDESGDRIDEPPAVLDRNHRIEPNANLRREDSPGDATDPVHNDDGAGATDHRCHRHEDPGWRDS